LQSPKKGTLWGGLGGGEVVVGDITAVISEKQSPAGVVSVKKKMKTSPKKRTVLSKNQRRLKSFQGTAARAEKKIVFIK